MMGGKLEVHSEEGAGSDFHFTARFDLPEVATSARASAPSPARSSPATDPADLAGLRVLVVDDNATNRTILCEMLGNWRMSPTPASGAPERWRC
jgi:hypothetical protein